MQRLPADLTARVPLRWLRPGTYRWAGPVVLVGGADARLATTVWREPDGATCVVIRRRGFWSWLLGR